MLKMMGVCDLAFLGAGRRDWALVGQNKLLAWQLLVKKPLCAFRSVQKPLVFLGGWTLLPSSKCIEATEERSESLQPSKGSVHLGRESYALYSQ